MLAHVPHWMIMPFFSAFPSYVVFILSTSHSFHPSVLAVEQLLPLGCRLPHPGVFAAGELLKWQKIQDLPQVSAICGTSHNNTASFLARDSQGASANLDIELNKNLSSIMKVLSPLLVTASLSALMKSKSKNEKRIKETNAQAASAVPLLNFQPCQNETAGWFSRTITSICDANTGRERSLTCCFNDVIHAKAASIQRKRNGNIPFLCSFIGFTHAFYLLLLILIFSPALLSLPLISRSLSNVSPGCVLFPSSVTRTAPAAHNTNCSLMLCLGFFPVSCGSLGPQLCIDLHFFVRSHNVWVITHHHDNTSLGLIKKSLILFPQQHKSIYLSL